MDRSRKREAKILRQTGLVDECVDRLAKLIDKVGPIVSDIKIKVTFPMQRYMIKVMAHKIPASSRLLTSSC